MANSDALTRERGLPADARTPSTAMPWRDLTLFAAVTLGSLVAVMAVGTAAAQALGAAWDALVSPLLGSAVTAAVPWPPLAAAVLWAIDSGLLAILTVGVPFVLSFYVVLSALEESGYLAASGILSDRLMASFGLPGRAAIPILAATGCSVPAVYATRALDTRRERLLASFLVVLTPCSARSAVVAAVLAPFAGIASALAAFGVIAAVAVGSGLAANAIVPGRASPRATAPARIRAPVPRRVLRRAWWRFRSFLQVATPVMLAASFALGLAYETGAIGPIGDAIGPTVQSVLGLPPIAGIALVLAFLRKELALQLLVILAVADPGGGPVDAGMLMAPGQLMVYAVVTAISVPCAATVAALADELGWRSAISISAAVLGVGIGTGAVLARLLGLT